MGSTTNHAAKLRGRWLELRELFPEFTPPTFRGFLWAVAAKPVYPEDWQKWAKKILKYAPHLIDRGDTQ